MRWYKADLHIHSVLSPCGGLEMAPQVLMEKVKENGIDIIAITDHNSMANCLEYEKVANRYGIKLIYGMEIQTAEEIHAIALFDEWVEAEAFSLEIYNSLLPIDNDPEYFGDQVVISANEKIIRFEEKALINSSMFSFDEVLEKVNDSHGLIFPAHVDAVSYSMIGQLGFIPEDSGIIALGVTAKCDPISFLKENEYLKKYALIKNSDAHYLTQIGSGFTDCYLQIPTVEELRKAFLGLDGRKVKCN